MSPLVEEVLKSLTNMVNLSTGLLHPSDESAAKIFFNELHKEGETLDGSEITEWAIRNKWQQKYAQELGKLAQKIGDDGRVVIKNKNILKPNIIQIMKERISKNA